MDVSEYDCGVRQEDNNKIKLAESYGLTGDTGYESFYNGCSSVLTEKSFSRESFDICSPKTPNLTPNKQCSALKYHISTPKNNASPKRHLYISLSNSSSISKRIKSENDENEPQTLSTGTCKSGQKHDNSFPLKVLNNYEISRQNYLLSSTVVQGFQKPLKDEVFDTFHSTHNSYNKNKKDKVLLPQRPSKNHKYFTPSVIHSKRKLEILPVDEKVVRMFCNGMRYLNIIKRLEPFPVILDDIFKNLTSEDLFSMSLVSKTWSRIVKSNPKANTRIQHYLNESHNVKENHREPAKLAITKMERHPFGEFNLMSHLNKNTSTSSVNSSFYENQNVVQQLHKNERLVKCPRCCKGSIVSDSTERLQRMIAIYNSQSATSVVRNAEPDSIRLVTKVEPVKTTSVYFGVCTSLACKYMFCPKCLCDYHPGDNCKISEPESPSKLLICRKKSKLKTKPSCKINSKRQSLRRLCFS